MPQLVLIPKREFDRVRAAGSNSDTTLALLADMCRANALTAVKQAGSGHLGSSFSALDLVVHLLWERLNMSRLGFDSPDRDVFFSSKGHDVPGLYAALHALGVLPSDSLARLRRFGGPDGHPDISVRGIEANTGSLGMGISKGRGIAWAKRHLRRGGRVVVMTGDGELQEGQNWEALQSAAHDRLGKLCVVVDRNELQSDKATEDILSLGDLEAKLRAFGWAVDACDGHDHAAIRAALDRLDGDSERPKALVARTVKGRGVSFMEHPFALREGGGTYRWHAGAPDDESFERAHTEILERIGAALASLGVAPVSVEPLAPPAPAPALYRLDGEPESGAGAPGRRSAVTDEFVSDAYGEALLELAGRRRDLVVLDADLASDCRIRGFELRHPERFLENGIAEQDMVSAAAGIARHGLLPVVNSFASFLASRANEQIYNQASEGSKVVYALHYAGLIPAGPGKSHQSLRDISLLAAIPGVTVVQPTNAAETAALLEWAVEEAEESVAIRLAIGPSPRRIDLPAGYRVAPGRGTTLREGDDGVLLSYGPVMLHEALTAAELLEKRGARLQVVAMPWLDRFDQEWLLDVLGPFEDVFVLEDHAPAGGLGDALLRSIVRSGAHEHRSVTVFGVEGWPACGTPLEALRHHRLDGASLAARIVAAMRDGVRT